MLLNEKYFRIILTIESWSTFFYERNSVCLFRFDFL